MTRPRICVTVTAPTTAELRARRDAVGAAELLELRLDSVADPDVAGALAGRKGPVIVTCRAAWEGGSFKGSEEERRRLLAEALAAGAEYVDIEQRAAFDDLVAADPSRVVLSRHDFEGVPGDLADIARAMQATGAGVVKIAVKTDRLTDCLPLLALSRSMAGSRVLIGMGEAGLATRVLAARFGSAWTYAGELGGVGQVSLTRLQGEYRFGRLGSSTNLYGVVGSPVSHSVSPAMHNAAFGAAGPGGIDAVYLPLPARDVDDFVTFARAFELRGASVTIPFKVALLEHVDAVDPLAQQVGAINTIRSAGGRWEATNTDVSGFLQPLRTRGLVLKAMRASILGAGGAARAVAAGLSQAGALVRVHARQSEQAARLAAAVNGVVGPWPPEAGTWDLLVNTTPVGMHPRISDSPMVPEALTGQVVYDLIYNPTVTRLLADAARAGLSTIGGLDMLVGQAEEQFRYWTGISPQPGVMRRAAETRLSEFATDEAHVV